MQLPRVMVEDILRRALQEDLGRGGDLTTDAIVVREMCFEGHIVARGSGTAAGLDCAGWTLDILDSSVECHHLVVDGEPVSAGTPLLRIAGPARAVLTGERTALNLLGRMMGIATLTSRYVNAVQGSGARVVCTRKTTPGLRAIEKYAVRCGGGSNHRFGLDDAVLIKDNHLAVAGSISAAVARVRRAVGHTVKVELEVDTLEQLEQGLAVGVDAVLLDNMKPEMLRRAVEIADGRVVTEASGGINLETAAEIAATGVDLLSVGALTHSARCLDVGLDA